MNAKWAILLGLVVLAGCAGQGQSDGLFGRTVVPPPGTGAITPVPSDPYYAASPTPAGTNPNYARTPTPAVPNGAVPSSNAPNGAIVSGPTPTPATGVPGTLSPVPSGMPGYNPRYAPAGVAPATGPTWTTPRPGTGIGGPNETLGTPTPAGTTPGLISPPSTSSPTSAAPTTTGPTLSPAISIPAPTRSNASAAPSEPVAPIQRTLPPRAQDNRLTPIPTTGGTVTPLDPPPTGTNRSVNMSDLPRSTDTPAKQ